MSECAIVFVERLVIIGIDSESGVYRNREARLPVGLPLGAKTCKGRKQTLSNLCFQAQK